MAALAEAVVWAVGRLEGGAYFRSATQFKLAFTDLPFLGTNLFTCVSGIASVRVLC